MEKTGGTDGMGTAIVTGASRGIGAAVARELAAQGYDLVLTCSRTMDELHKVSEEIAQRYGVSCQPYRCDGGDPSAVRSLFAALGEVDLSLLVNNAGISYIGLLQEMTDEAWARVMATNLNSCFYFCRAAVPLFLRRRRGAIVNVSSVWGTAGASMEAAYSASKGGVNALTRALAKELAPSGIAVNALSCGVIDTEMNRCFSEEEREALRAEIPADRFGTAQEAAQAVAALARMPSYLTGQVVTMDGGWM